MSATYPGGLITKTPVTPADGVASGIWTLAEQAYWQKQGAWTAQPDPYFENVSLLLSGDGTNGAQNNTFLDSSTNNFTITRNGNITQGSFSPYGNLWSNYFSNASAMSLAFPSNTAFAFGIGDFTVEGWINGSGLSGAEKGIWGIGPTGGSADNTTVRINAGKFSFWCGGSGNNVPTSTTLSDGVWYHFALVRQSGTFKFYINGTLDTTSTTGGSYSQGAQSGKVGQNYNDQNIETFNGYISNIRVVKGTAVYTSNFTPSTTPLTAISGTSLLTCQSNRFIDNSSNAFALTVNGTPSVQRFSPFNPTAPYSTSVIGGSGYFDGSGDYLTLPSSSNLAFGTGDFSVEAFVYTTSMANNANVLSNTTSTDTQFGLLWLANGTLRLAGWNTAFLSSASGVIKANQWQHVVCCRTGTTASLFADGVRVATGTVSNNFSSTDAFNIGRNPTPFDNLVGYMSNLRVLKGSSAYDPTATTITVPTAPVTAITNTQLLTNFTNAGIPDLAMQNNLETVGNAQVSTSVKKYGTGSLAFDGSTSYLGGYNPAAFLFGAGDFTIECWAYPTTFGSERCILSTASPTDSQGFTLNVSSSGKLIIGFGAGSWTILTTSGGSLSTNQWQHIALTRSGNTFYAFVNGTQTWTTTNSIALTNTNNAIWVGGRTAGGGQYFIGNIDDVRITKGLARYTANFTPPASAFPKF